MSLSSISFYNTNVADITPLSGMPLEEVLCDDTTITTLEPLRGTPLRKLHCVGTLVTDLSPLRGMNLQDSMEISSERIQEGIEVIRSIKSLRNISTGLGDNQKNTPAEFWKKYDAGEFGKPAAPARLAHLLTLPSRPGSKPLNPCPPSSRSKPSAKS